MKPALLVIDMQKDALALGPATAQSMRTASGWINHAIGLFRRRGLPVIAVQHIDEKEGLVPGTDRFELVEEIALQPADRRIHKKYGNAFNKTSLEAELREQGIDTVILTGFCAEYCVLSTCRGAEDRDFTAVILRGSLASPVAEHIRLVEAVNEIISLDALAKALETA
jgi:nicotinamidase-related amidase